MKIEIIFCAIYFRIIQKCKNNKTISKKSGSEATYSIRQCSTAASDVCHSFEIVQDILNGIDIANMTIKGHFFIPKDFLQKKINIFSCHHNCKNFRLCIELNTRKIINRSWLLIANLTFWKKITKFKIKDKTHIWIIFTSIITLWFIVISSFIQISINTKSNILLYQFIFKIHIILKNYKI